MNVSCLFLKSVFLCFKFYFMHQQYINAIITHTPKLLLGPSHSFSLRFLFNFIPTLIYFYQFFFSLLRVPQNHNYITPTSHNYHTHTFSPKLSPKSLIYASTPAPLLCLLFESFKGLARGALFFLSSFIDFCIALGKGNALT